MAASISDHNVMGIIRASRPSFRNAYEKAAFAFHASFLASGYLLHATGPPAFADDVLSSTSTEDDVGIENWNEFDGSYAFVYSNPSISSKKVLVKCLALNGKLLVDALREGDPDELFHLEIEVGDYVTEDGGGNGNYTSMFKDLGKLVKVIDDELVGKLNGLSSKKPSSESSNAGRGESTQPSPPVSEPAYPYTVIPPPEGYVVPPIPDSGGYSDVLPGPGAGMYPSRGDYGRPGSSHIGPNDPLFLGMGRGPVMPGGFQPGVPPGARFDPYGPPGVPGFEPNRFIRDPRRPGRGNHPDLEPFRDDSDFL